MAEIRLCVFSDEASSDILGQINAIKNILANYGYVLKGDKYVK